MDAQTEENKYCSKYKEETGEEDGVRKESVKTENDEDAAVKRYIRCVFKEGKGV